MANFENFNTIWNIFQDTQDFVVLADPVIIYIYLGITERHFRDQGRSVIPPQSYQNIDLVQTLNTFRNPSLQILAAGKASLV